MSVRVPAEISNVAFVSEIWTYLTAAAAAAIPVLLGVMRVFCRPTCACLLQSDLLRDL